MPIILTDFIEKEKPEHIWLVDIVQKDHLLILKNTYKLIYEKNYKTWNVYLFKKNNDKIS